MVRGVAVALTATFVLTACGGGDDGDTLDDLRASQTPAAEETAEDDPDSWLDRAPDAPPEAPAADESDAGAIAFTEYVFQLILYTRATNDSTAFEEIAAPGCELCANLVDSVRQSDEVQISSDEPVAGEAEVTSSEDGFVTVRRTFTIADGAQVDAESGEVVAELPSRDFTLTLNVQWTGGSWTLLRYQIQEDS